MSKQAGASRSPGSRDLRGTWPKALLSFFGSIIFIMAMRWAFLEPYVIPSGSMIPSLMVNDHILVNKFSFGLRIPFTSRWLFRFSLPRRGDVIVFRSQDDPGVFLVKRVIGLPGDDILIRTNGQILINGEEVRRRQLDPEETREVLTGLSEDFQGISGEEAYDVFEENFDDKVVFVLQDASRELEAEVYYDVPEGSLFMMGDNRDHSSDSRSFGAVNLESLLGRASLVWLSCEDVLPETNRICDPKSIRKGRFFKRIR
jgi:signal peptidase I